MYECMSKCEFVYSNNRWYVRKLHKISIDKVCVNSRQECTVKYIQWYAQVQDWLGLHDWWSLRVCSLSVQKDHISGREVQCSIEITAVVREAWHPSLSGLLLLCILSVCGCYDSLSKCYHPPFIIKWQWYKIDDSDLLKQWLGHNACILGFSALCFEIQSQRKRLNTVYFSEC